MRARKSSKTASSGGSEDRSSDRLFERDLAFQRRQWQVERVCWAAMVLLIVAALAGVFGGGGPLARTSASDSAGTADVQYDRFARVASSTTLDVKVTASSSARHIRLRLSDQYLSAMNVRAITPPPASSAVADQQQVFIFERSASPASATIRFELEPTTLGTQRGWIAVDDGAPVSFAHFVYP